jgi:hypothetical protein
MIRRVESAPRVLRSAPGEALGWDFIERFAQNGGRLYRLTPDGRRKAWAL